MKKLMLLVVAVSLAAISFGQTKEKNMVTISRVNMPEGVALGVSLTHLADAPVDFFCNLWVTCMDHYNSQYYYYPLRVHLPKGAKYDYVYTDIPPHAYIMVEVHSIGVWSEKYEYELSNEVNSFLE